jgi:hypothetical protein
MIGSGERGATSEYLAPKEEKKKDDPQKGGARRACGNRGEGSKLRQRERRSSDRQELKGRRHRPRRRRSGSQGSKTRKEKAFITEEITIRAESVEGEDSDIILSSDSESAFIALTNDNARLKPLNIDSRRAQYGGYLDVTGIGAPSVECGRDRWVASAKVSWRVTTDTAAFEWRLKHEALQLENPRYSHVRQTRSKFRS